MAPGRGRPVPADALRVAGRRARWWRESACSGRPCGPRSSERSAWCGASAAPPFRPASSSTSTGPASRRRDSSPWWRSGEPVTFKVRAPRYALERPIIVSAHGTQVEARTLNVSEGGCSILWPGGDPPTPGELLALRLANGFLAPTTEAVVCWTSGDSLEKNLGLRIVSEGRGGRAWRNGASRRRPGGSSAPPGGERGRDPLPAPGQGRRRSPRAPGDVARHRRDPGLHAGGDGGEREDARAARPRRSRRRDRSSATPTICSFAPVTSGSARLGGLHRFMSWGGSAAHRLGRLPGLQPAGGHSRRRRLAGADRRGRGDLPLPPRRLAPVPLARDAPSDVQLDLGADVIMAFDECPPSLAERAYHEQSLARTQRWLLRCRDAWLARPSAADGETPRALRDRPGRALPRPAPAGHRGGRRARPARLRPGRLRGGGGRRRSMWEGVARHAPALPSGQAPLPHGRGHARGPARRDRRRRRHVRLRPAHPHAPATACSSPAGAGSPSGTPASPTTRARPTRTAPATPAGPSPGPTCATSSGPRRSWRSGSTRSTTCTTTCAHGGGAPGHRGGQVRAVPARPARGVRPGARRVGVACRPGFPEDSFAVACRRKNALETTLFPT